MTRERRPTLVLGGTFDPVHHGHLALVEAATQALGLREVLFLPARRPPHKVAAELSAIDHREAMLKRAIEGREGWGICRHEIERPQLRFTVDTLTALADEGVVPVFALGGDSLRNLTSWRDWETLLDRFDFVAYGRPEDGGAAFEGLAPAVADRLIDPAAVLADDRAPLGHGGRILRLPGAPVPISSSEVRDRRRAGEVVDDLVPPGVARYIRDHSLYAPEEIALSDSLPPTVRRAIEAAVDRLAGDIVALDLRGRSDVTDFFVVCHGGSDRQVQAIADHIVSTLRNEMKTKPAGVEGRRGTGWMLLDYIDFVVHVFDESSREFYRLERLWGDAPEIDISDLVPDGPRPDFDAPRSAPPS